MILCIVNARTQVTVKKLKLIFKRPVLDPLKTAKMAIAFALARVAFIERFHLKMMPKLSY